MRIIIRTKNYVIKEVTKEGERSYPYAVFTKEEAAFHSLGYPEWECDTVEECLNNIEEAESRNFQATSVPEYKDQVRAWLDKLKH